MKNSINLDHITIKPIVTEEDYHDSKEIINQLVDADLIQDKNQREHALNILESISLLVIAYEKKHHYIQKLDPIDAIQQRLEMLNLPQKEIAKYLGGANRVSEILNKKRPLTLKMAKALYQHFGIPAEVLLG